MEVEGLVIEKLPNLFYRVEIEGKEYICYLAGRMRLNHISVMVGDKVRVVLDPHKGKTTNRITYRLQ